MGRGGTVGSECRETVRTTDTRVGLREFSGKLATAPKLATDPREFSMKLATKCETGNNELITVASLGALLPIWAS